MKKIGLILLLTMAGCQTPPEKRPTTLDQINDEMAQAVRASAKPAAPDAVSQALLPPLRIEMPKSSPRIAEQKFDLVVNNAPASQVFLGIISGTRYSMLVHPEVAGSITVNLKDVTVIEALDAIHLKHACLQG